MSNRKIVKACAFVVLSLFCLLSSCNQNIEQSQAKENNLEKIVRLQNELKSTLKKSLEGFSSDGQRLLSSVVFDDKKSEEIVKTDGLFQSNDILDDDAVFDTLSEREQTEIKTIAENYFEKIQQIAKGIKVFDKEIPNEVYEDDEFVEYNGIKYSKLIPETLEIAYQIRDELYNGNKDGRTQEVYY